MSSLRFDRRRLASTLLLAAGATVFAASVVVMADALSGDGRPSDAIRAQATPTPDEGDIPELVEAGVGDPRPALPEGYAMGYAEIFCDLPSEDECAARGPGDRRGLRFEGSWGSGEGFLNITVGALPEEAPRIPGRLTEGSYTWNDGELSYHVSGQDGQASHTHGTLAAIARALDPGFDERCLLTSVAVPLHELGLAAPIPPEGYRLDHSGAWRNDLSGDCTGVADAEAGFFATWIFINPGQGVIDVQAGRNATDMTVVGQRNSVTPYGFYWTDANGVDYVVNGFKAEFEEALLVQVAESVDPAFDLARLAPAR